jgi:hypothetical protein
VVISTVLCVDINFTVWGYLMYGIGMSTVWCRDIYCMVRIPTLGYGISTVYYGDVYCMV